MIERSPTGESKKAASKYRWTVLTVLTLTQTGASVAALSFGPLAPFLQSAFGINRTQVGLLTSSLYLGSILVGIPAGSLSDRVGVRRLLLVGPGMMGLFFLAISGARSYGFLWLLVLLTGMGYGVINPATAKAIVHWFDARGRATALGIKQSGVTAGAAIAASMLPWLTIALGLRTTLVLTGLLILGLAFLCFGLNRDFAPRRPQKENEKAFGGLRRVIFNRNLMLAAFADSLWSAVQLIVSTYLVLYLKEKLLFPVVTAGTCLAAVQVSGGVGRVVWGIISDRVFGGKRKLVLMLIGVVTTGSTLAMAVFTPDTPGWLLYADVTLIGFSVLGRHGVSMAFFAELAGTELAGAATGVYITVAYLGIIVGPPLFGHIVDLTGSYPLAWLTFGGVSAMATLIFHRVRPGPGAPC